MSKLSVVIITLNEEDNIGRCIDSVREVADDVLVVDSFSTDRTAEIVKAKGARFIQHKFEGHIQQKNFAKDQAAYEYVLSLDADEFLSGELIGSIKFAKQNLFAEGYTMNRLNFYCGRAVYTCGWYPDTKLRLWKRDKGKWTGTNPHDRFRLKEKDSIIVHLRGNILHNTYPTHQSFIEQKEKFATISAQHLKTKPLPVLILKVIFSTPFKFIRTYFLEGGFTEGKTGLIICYYQTKEVMLKYWRAIKFKFK